MAILYEDQLLRVSQPIFGGWKVFDKSTGATLIPNSVQREKNGFVWLPLSRKHKARSINARYSEMVMFQFFGLAVIDPSSQFGKLWDLHTPEELISMFIEEANTRVRDGFIDLDLL